MRTYWFKHGLRSANDIFGRYAPASDCIGSVDRVPNTGRCPNGENPTWLYARRVAGQLGLKPDQNIGLFSGPNTVDMEVARVLAQAVSSFELGQKFRVSIQMVDQGVKEEGFSYSR